MTEQTSQPACGPVSVAYGGGTNSTALLVLLHEQGRRPDRITFSDTGGEKPHTYEHVKVVSDWCESIGFPPILTLKKGGRQETLEEKCLRSGFLPSIAYGWKTCSTTFKRDPQEKDHNNWPMAREAWAAGLKVIKLLGYDADEERRAKIKEDAKYVYQYPLIEADWTREDCVAAIARAGLPQPGKSACFFCPSSKKHEIVELAQKYPDLYERALAMERNAAAFNTSIKGLGRRFAWSDVVIPIVAETLPESGIEQDCGCYDG